MISLQQAPVGVKERFECRKTPPQFNQGGREILILHIVLVDSLIRLHCIDVSDGSVEGKPKPHLHISRVRQRFAISANLVLQ